MSVFRRTYRVGGEARTARFYSYSFRRPDGQLVRGSTRCTNRRAAEVVELAKRTAIEQGAAGIVAPAEKGKRWEDQVKEFVAYLRKQRRAGEDYCQKVRDRLLRIGREAGWFRLMDVSLAGWERWRASYDGKPKSSNQYLDCVRAMCRWAMARNKLRANPLEHAEKAKALPNPDYRRALTVDEVQRLLAAAPPDRAMFYRFVLYCPLRRRTLEALTWDAIDFDRQTLTVQPEDMKTGKAVVLPLRDDVCAELWKSLDRATAKRVFGVPTIDQLREDLAAAKIAAADEHGERRVDLHSLRKTAATWIVDAGLPIQIAQQMLQHRNIMTTVKMYLDSQSQANAAEAVARLPEIGQNAPGARSNERRTTEGKANAQ